MEVQAIQMEPAAAAAALRTYKEHRSTHDARDWEIERIYRQIAKGNKVISLYGSIRAAGIDERGRPRLAIVRADQPFVSCDYYSSERVTFEAPGSRAGYFGRSTSLYIQVPWPDRARRESQNARAIAPRIPPQHRPAASALKNYHILWEAEWKDYPRDPFLIRRIAGDAWVVLAAWDLTDVEIAVMRARQS